MLDTEPFYFPLESEPVLPVAEYRHCPYGKHFLPATFEHFAGSRDRHGNFRYQTYCRPCTAIYRRERYVRLKSTGVWDKGKIKKRWCPYGKHWLPATAEHFSPLFKRSRDHRSCFPPYCRACFKVYRHLNYVRLRDAGVWRTYRRGKK